MKRRKMAAAAIIFIFMLSSFATGLLRLTVKFGATVVAAPQTMLTYDDFNDGELDTNLGGSAGAMSYDGAHDPSLSFVSGYEGLALRITYSVPEGQWCGYWSFFLASRKGYDVGRFTDIRMWVRGGSGGENFKIEIEDEFGLKRTVYVSMVHGFENGLSTSWRELVIPLYNFPDLNPYYLKQVNIVFDTYPYSGTVYIDNIVFTQFSPYTSPPVGLVLDDFNGGLGPNRLGGSHGTMDPDPSSSTEWITMRYVTDADEGLGALKLSYDRGTSSWVGYWSYLRPDQSGFDVSDYENLAVWVKGASGGENFKIELKDTAGGTSSRYVTVPGTAYQKVSVPLSEFAGVDLENLKQVSIVFDTPPNSGTIYVDLILFEWDFYKEAQRRAFLYFWREMHPQTGLVPDKNRDKMASIAATGFGLSAICIGESRGWISREDAESRVLKVLQFLRDNIERVNGIPYHFVWIDNGRRYVSPQLSSEVSIVDAAILMCGVLHAAEHFKDNQQIVSLANQLFDSVDWYWFLRPSGTFAACWTPEKGFYGERLGYDEYILAGIVALGSTTNPLPRSSWDRWRSGYAWATYENYVFLCPGGYVRPTSYLYHFPASWLDFRNKHDNFVDYWETMVEALLANREYCIDWANEHSGYDNKLWGWNACEGPTGYLGWDPFQGTIAPSAVVGSVPFIPELAIPDARYIFDSYGENIWGVYGFKDSMDSGRNWFCSMFVGINKGTEVLLPEAYISGLVWEEMMRNFHVLEGMRKAGFVWRIYPTDDTFVDNAYPSANYGQENYLRLENTASSTKLAYIKFDLSGLPTSFGIGEAKLNVFVYENAQAQITVYKLDNDGWSENALTWSNRPAYGENIGAAACENGWISIDLTQWVRTQFAQDRMASVVVAISQGSARLRSDEYAENAKQRPYLGVTLASTRTVSERLVPTEDAYTDSNLPDNVLGVQNQKRLAVSGISGYYRRSYLKFDLSPLPKEAKISEVRLWVYAREVLNSGNPVKTVYACRLDNDDWSESSLKWSNQPDNGPVISENSIASTGWVSWDVTSWVQDQMGVDNIVSLVLRMAEPASTVDPWFESKEELLGHIPFLEVKYYEARGPPVLLSPENNATTFDNTPTFRWIPSGGASGHVLQIDNDPDFSSPIYENANLSGSAEQCTIENELPEDNYYWRVGAVFGGETMWSEARRLQVLRSITLTLYPVADTKVESANPDTNYGGESQLAAAGASPLYYRRSFLRFDLSSLPGGGTVVDAKLYLYKVGDGGTEPGDISRNVGAYRVDNDSWGEFVITWNNQPSIGSLENYIYTPTTYDFWEVFDVTSWADNQYKGDMILSIALKMLEERTDWNSAEPYWRSREAGENERPYLRITIA